MPVTQIGVHLPNLVGASPSGGGSGSEIVVKARPSMFAELVDIANPLQHVPLVGDIYRAKSGDGISDGAKFAGHVAIGAAAGGPVGALVGAGVFLVEKLFGGGGRSSQTEAPGLSVRSEDRAAAEILFGHGSERAAARSQTAAQRPSLSSAEFAALVASFDVASTAAKNRDSDDIAVRMRNNLDKLDALRAGQ
jgi:predicted RecA/RadA family phage recombinase